MRKGVIIGAIVALALTFALWMAATVDKSPLNREKGRGKKPVVVAGRDLADREVMPVRVEGETADIRCSYQGEHGPGTLVAMGTDAVEGSDLSLVLAPGSWNIMWKPAVGKAVNLGTIDAEAQEVYTCRLTDGGYVVDGTVLGKKGGVAPDVEVNVCGNRVRTDGNGAFRGVAKIRRCIVRATYTDGLLSRRSDPQTIEAFEAHDLEFVVDDSPIAGMGIAFMMRDEGARVTTVHLDTPAEAAGLREGDIIRSIDGTATAGLSNDDFVALGTGEEGSLVTLEIDRDGSSRTISFRRRRLAAEDTGG